MVASAHASRDLAAEALEDALGRLGPFGLYQRYVAIMLCIPNLLAAMYTLNYVFVADQVPFRCVVPECEGNYTQFHNPAAQALLPADSRCDRYLPLQDAGTVSCQREDFHQNDTKACNHFVYESMSTTFAEFDLGCREWMRTLVGTVRNAALPLALLLTGYISDTYGRRTAFCIFSAFAAVLGIVKGLSINYQMYVAMEFFEAALGYGFNSAGYVMMVELARPSLRASFACATGVAYGLGGMLFALIAWKIQYWRHLLYTVHSFALLLPLYWLLVDESPRWLHAKGRTEETVDIIKKAARWNKIQVSEEILFKLSDKDSMKSDSDSTSSNPWLRLLRSRVLVGRFAICSWCWVAVAFVYYGLTINSVSLSGDKYANFALNMSMEIVASLLIMMALERFGRKWSIFVAFLVCGVACVTPYFTSHAGAGLGMFFVGKLAITFAFNSMYVFTAELFPTSVRSSALAACSLVGRVGSILAPQTPLLSIYIQALLYGAFSCLAALAVLMVPETRRARLPRDVTDAEHIRGSSPSPAPAPAPADTPRTVVLSADT
ncbi:organic cation transporter protein-like [Bombyx mandarina]|uniref:Organic cation transporter protein-like n=1 Tax=Bombyx mandarina TaxID=7092 RepID=A0A6J2KQ35_BOMMA|nr:organic cation transporter protein-like [Bombyx mandarina]